MEGKAIISALNWRYATKKFDPEKKLTPGQVDTLIESLRLTPTSYGLQAMKAVLVENPEIREKLVEYSLGQKQVVDASHLIVICRVAALDLDHIDSYMENMAETRRIKVETLSGFKNMIVNSILTKDEDFQEIWMNKQTYIALGNLLNVCAQLGIDACPMEGFLPKEYDEVLDLKSKGLASVLVVPVGYRDSSDANASKEKVRRKKEDFLVKI